MANLITNATGCDCTYQSVQTKFHMMVAILLFFKVLTLRSVKAQCGAFFCWDLCQPVMTCKIPGHVKINLFQKTSMTSYSHDPSFIRLDSCQISLTKHEKFQISCFIYFSLDRALSITKKNSAYFVMINGLESCLILVIEYPE